MKEQGITVLSVRLTEAEVAKLDKLATMTHRTRSHVVRLLLAQASLTQRSDIAVGQGITPVLSPSA